MSDAPADPSDQAPAPPSGPAMPIGQVPAMAGGAPPPFVAPGAVPGHPQVQMPPQAPPGAAPNSALRPEQSGWVWTANGWVRAATYPMAPIAMAPPQPSIFERFWPGPGRTEGAPRLAISLIVVAAVVGAVGLVIDLPGFGWLLTAITMAALAVATGLVSASGAGKPAPATEAVPAATTPAPEAGVDRDSESATDRDAGEDVVEKVAVESGATVEKRSDKGRTRSRVSLAEHGERVFWGVCALALVSVGTFRAAGWLFFWCVVFALGCTAMALAGGRTVRALFASVWAPVMAIFRAPIWIVRGIKSPRQNGGPRIVIAIAISVLLLLVFGGLFAGADAEFRHVLGAILPPLRASEIARAIFCFIVVGAVACGVAFLAAARPRFDEMEPITPRTVRRAEWVLPLTVLNLLFAVFVYIQLAALFGADKSLANASRAYMRGYAHRGFWQLLAVSLLTLTVLLITSRIAPRETSTDRTLLRILLGGLTVFSIVIVLAALKRIFKYEHLYGYTRLRVVVAGIEVWFGLLFVLILIAGITLRASWLPRIVAASLVLSLLAGAIANPDGYVARQNVDRYHNTGKLSISYMRQLSADAVPAIDSLPPHLRACVLKTIAAKVLARGDDWRTWNTSRVDARNQLYSYVKPAKGSCKGPIG